jgi:hypothetical protein
LDYGSSAMAYERVSLSEVVRFRAPEGFTDALTRATARDLTSASEFVRRALFNRLREAGVPVPVPRMESDQLSRPRHLQGDEDRRDD